jgi:hypothetical protein
MSGDGLWQTGLGRRGGGRVWLSFFQPEKNRRGDEEREEGEAQYLYDLELSGLLKLLEEVSDGGDGIAAETDKVLDDTA